MKSFKGKGGSGNIQFSLPCGVAITPDVGQKESNRERD